ncbi:MAG: hypothetical protein J5748_06570 [Bacteroidales bacterium]|nr:hypothetical protein [Bacteroidales bacterium]
MKQTMRLQALLCLLLFAAPFAAAQNIAFWNVENYFNDPANSSGASFAPAGWTSSRFKSKTRGIAKVILAIADSLGQPPSVVGLCEVENAECMKALVRQPPLRKYGYRYVHYDSPDRRGIDCALLWRSGDGSPSGVCPGLGRLRASRAVPVRDTSGSVLPTRALLVVEFDSLSVVVCHLPSKRGGSSEASRRRLLALRALSALCDSLAKSDSGEFYPLFPAETSIIPQSGEKMGANLAAHRPIVLVGDFNDTRTAVSDSIMAPMLELEPRSPGSALPSAPGTIKFQGVWEQIDRAFASPGVDAALFVSALPFLSEQDKKYGGVKPRRTFIGPRYNAGLSDHYPIILSCARRRK